MPLHLGSRHPPTRPWSTVPVCTAKPSWYWKPSVVSSVAALREALRDLQPRRTGSLTRRHRTSAAAFDGSTEPASRPARGPSSIDRGQADLPPASSKREPTAKGQGSLPKCAPVVAVRCPCLLGWRHTMPRQRAHPRSFRREHLDGSAQPCKKPPRGPLGTRSRTRPFGRPGGQRSGCHFEPEPRGEWIESSARSGSDARRWCGTMRAWVSSVGPADDIRHLPGGGGVRRRLGLPLALDLVIPRCPEDERPQRAGPVAGVCAGFRKPARLAASSGHVVLARNYATCSHLATDGMGLSALARRRRSGSTHSLEARALWARGCLVTLWVGMGVLIGSVPFAFAAWGLSR